jgi:hypothetical protein
MVPYAKNRAAAYPDFADPVVIGCVRCANDWHAADSMPHACQIMPGWQLGFRNRAELYIPSLSYTPKWAHRKPAPSTSATEG